MTRQSGDAKPRSGPRPGRIFDEGPNAALGLSRLYDCVTVAYTSPRAGRPLHSQFLVEAAGLLGGEEGELLTDAAARFTASAQRWGELVDTVAGAHPEISRLCELSDRRTAALDEQPDSEVMAELEKEKASVLATSTVPASLVAGLYPALGALVDDIATLEEEALTILRDL